MISLRDLKEDDLATALKWRNSPEVANYMYGDHIITSEEHNSWFKSHQTDITRKYWIITKDETPVGMAYIYNINRRDSRANWGFYIAEKAGKSAGAGYFVEVFILIYIFDFLKLNKLCCEVFLENKTVWKMHLKIGFSQEGLLKNHISKNNHFHNIILMGMQRKEWQKIRKTHLDRLDRRRQSIPKFN